MFCFFPTKHHSNDNKHKKTRLMAFKSRVIRLQKCTIHTKLTTALSVTVPPFPPGISLNLWRSTASFSFKCRSFISLSTTSFYVLLGLPVCLASSTSEVTHLSPYHRQSYSTHIHTIAVYFIGPLLLSFTYLRAYLLQTGSPGLETRHHLICRVYNRSLVYV